MIARLVFALVLAGGLAGPAAALELTVDGHATQGGLMIGHTEPGASVRVDDADLRPAADGTFVFGFGRDHGPTATVTATKGGETAVETIDVAQRAYDIQRIDGLPDKLVTPDAETMTRIQREAALVGSARATDSDLSGFLESFQWPVEGIISGVYGSQRVLNGEPRRPHFGVDIAASEGTPIRAPADGRVTMAEKTLYFTGGTVIIDHGHGISTTYLHMSRLDVKVGDTVTQGEMIGAVGKTGRATGPHLCWRLNWFQERLDAALVVPAMPPPAAQN